MFNLKNITLGIITGALITGNALAGPANKVNEDHLVKSYMVISVLAKNGNRYAIGNKKTIYSFLNNDQRVIVDRLIASQRISNNKI